MRKIAQPPDSLLLTPDWVWLGMTKYRITSNNFKLNMQEGRAARPFQAPQTGFSKLIAGHHDWEDGEELQLCKTEIKSLVKKSFIQVADC